MIRFSAKVGAITLALGMPAALTPALGCGGGSGGGGAAAAPSANDPEVKARKAELEKNIDIVKKALSGAPLDLESTRSQAEKYRAAAATDGFKDLVQKCEQLKKDAETAFLEAAEKETKEACRMAREYAKAGDTKKARNRLNVHKALRNDDRYWTQIEAALQDVKKAERADAYFTKVTVPRTDEWKGREEFEKARGVLEGFLAIPAFAQSSKAKDVEKLLSEVKPAAEKARAARLSDQAIKPTPCFTGKNDELTKLWEMSDPMAVNVTDNVATFLWSNDQDSDSGNMRCGEDTWEDYDLDLTFKLISGHGWVNFHPKKDEEGGYGWGKCIELSTSDFKDTSRWWKIRATVRGKELKWTVPGTTMSGTKKLGSKVGPFEIRMEKGGKIQLKAVWVKVVKKSEG